MMAKTGLVVDDAALMRMRLKDILSAEFQVVAEAEDGEMALALYRRYRPDFVTLDITMPRTDGLEALGQILDAFPEARVIIVSAVGQRQLVFQALSRGAKDFVIKPFDPARVVGAVRRLFPQESS
jgi:two-component system chemotaxis response regulator CheY